MGGAISLPVRLSAQSPRSPGDTWPGPVGSPAHAQERAPAHGHVLSGTHVAGLTGWVGNVFINAVFRANSLSILTSGLFPGALVGTSPAPPAPLPLGFCLLSLCNPCPDCYLRGTAFPAFVSLLPLGPWLPLKSIRANTLSNLPRAGGWRGEAGGWTQLGPPIVCHRAPTPRLPHPLTPCPTHSSWSTQWGNCHPSLSAVSFQALAPTLGSPYVPLVGAGTSETNLSIVGLFLKAKLMWLFFPQST